MRFSKLLLSKFIVFISLAIVPVAASGQVNAEQVMNIGRNVLSMDDYMLAIQYFNQAIKAKPYLSEPYYYRAIAKLSLDDYAGAIQDCSLSIERNRFKPEVYKLRGFAQQHLGRDSLAILDYDRGLEYNPYDKFFLYYKAVAQTQAKRYAGADSTFKQLLRLHPAFEDGYAEYARMNLLRADTVAALENLNKTISLSRTVVNAYLMKADIEAKKGEWNDALKDINEAIRLEPQASDLYVNRAWLNYNLDNFFGAMSDYNYALELDPTNFPAMYNRALLLTQVRDYRRAYQAFSDLLKYEPDNFHAIYNRALISLDMQNYKDAERDFRTIAAKYPRFYPVYYGIAQCRQAAGDMKNAIINAHKGDELVRKYVKNPVQNPLDRPIISRETSKEKSSSIAAEDNQSAESEIEVMEKFNRLVTVASTDPQPMTFNEKIKGKVQDRNVQVAPEPSYTLSFIAPEVSLQSKTSNFKQLDNINEARILQQRLYLRANVGGVVDAASAQNLFKRLDILNQTLSQQNPRPVDWLERGVTHTMLKNYEAAISDFDKAISLDNDFVVAIIGRAFCEEMLAMNKHINNADIDDASSDENNILRAKQQRALLQLALSDYDKVLQINPEIAYVWFNKGNIYYNAGDYTSAISCYTEAQKIDSEFGQAYFNRGLAYLQAGNKKSAFADLGKAGELGVLPSYNLLKRMK